MNTSLSSATVAPALEATAPAAPAVPSPASPSSSPSAALSTLGRICVALGVGCLVLVAALVALGHPVDGALPACALVLVVHGMALCFPTLLQDGTTAPGGGANVSTMRVAVLVVVDVFALVTVKAGWSTASLADLKIDPSWAWVLGAALGGKAVQSFAENATK
jgi:hypothetical protein